MCYKSPWGRGREKRRPSPLAGGPWRRPVDIKLGRNYPRARHDKGTVGPQLKIVACASSVQHSTILVQFMLAAIVVSIDPIDGERRAGLVIRRPK
jgi:hypothetical protein